MSPEVLPVASAPDVLPNPIAKPDPEPPKADPEPEPSPVPPVPPAIISTLLSLFRHSRNSGYALFAF